MQVFYQPIDHGDETKNPLQQYMLQGLNYVKLFILFKNKNRITILKRIREGVCRDKWEVIC